MVRESHRRAVPIFQIVICAYHGHILKPSRQLAEVGPAFGRHYARLTSGSENQRLFTHTKAVRWGNRQTVERSLIGWVTQAPCEAKVIFLFILIKAVIRWAADDVRAEAPVIASESRPIEWRDSWNDRVVIAPVEGLFRIDEDGTNDAPTAKKLGCLRIIGV